VVEILLVEDSAADADLVREAIEGAKILVSLNVVSDGEQAMEYLLRSGRYKDSTRPDLILLDLNLPRKDGREVLQEVKSHPELCFIPVVVLTTSTADEDVLRSYRLHANAYIAKPVVFESFVSIVNQLADFWLSVVILPKV
jgi:CheY-like chemotaxis protein